VKEITDKEIKKILTTLENLDIIMIALVWVKAKCLS
jgi:hypothetical protein